MVSIRVYTELLKSYSHLIMWPGVALILSDTWEDCKLPSRFKAVQHPSLHQWHGEALSAQSSEELLWLRSEVTNMRLHNQPKPCKAEYAVLLIGVCLCCSRFSVFICPYGETIEAIFFAIMFSLLLFCGKSPFHSSLNLGLQPCWLTQVLLRLIIIDVRVLQIAQFQHSSNKNEVKFAAVNTETWESMCQLMSCFARKHFSWLWPAAVLINSRGILIVASAIFFESKASFQS